MSRLNAIVADGGGPAPAATACQADVTAQTSTSTATTARKHRHAKLCIKGSLLWKTTASPSGVQKHDSQRGPSGMQARGAIGGSDTLFYRHFWGVTGKSGHFRQKHLHTRNFETVAGLSRGKGGRLLVTHDGFSGRIPLDRPAQPGRDRRQMAGVHRDDMAEDVRHR